MLRLHLAGNGLGPRLQAGPGRTPLARSGGYAQLVLERVALYARGFFGGFGFLGFGGLFGVLSLT